MHQIFTKRKLIFLVLVLLIFVLTTLAIIKYLFSNNKVEENYLVSENTITSQPTLTPTIKLTPIPSPTPTIDIYAGMEKDKFFITFYGWPDNDPPGNEIAYPTKRYSNSKHNFASGVGTYQDPVTFASDPDEISVGTIYYVPNLRKYIIMEDYCEGCVQNFADDEKHFDIWVDSDPNFEVELVNCQKSMTKRNALVITNPSSNLPVRTTPFFNKLTGECNE